MAIVWIRDVDGGIYEKELKKRNLFGFVQVMRNLTTHHFVVTSPGARFINREINVHAGSQPVGAIDWEEPNLVQATVLGQLDRYETNLKAKPGRYKNEKANIDAARKSAQENLTDPVKLSKVFEKVVKEVAFGVRALAQAARKPGCRIRLIPVFWSCVAQPLMWPPGGSYRGSSHFQDLNAT